MVDAVGRVSWPTVAVVLGLGGIAALILWMGESDLAYTIAGGAVGYLGRGASR